MQMFATSKSRENADLSRRRFLPGAAAVPTAVVAPVALEAAEDDDNCHLMICMREERAQTVVQRVEVIQRCLRIFSQANRPPQFPNPEVFTFGKKHADRYFRACRDVRLFFFPGRPTFHAFFEEQVNFAVNRARFRANCYLWPAVEAHDYSRAASALIDQLQSRENWEVESEYRATGEEVTRPLHALLEIENNILTLAAIPFRHLRPKLDLHSIDNSRMGEDELRSILSSVSRP